VAPAESGLLSMAESLLPGFFSTSNNNNGEPANGDGSKNKPTGTTKAKSGAGGLFSGLRGPLAPYEYKPLDASKRRIRLLALRASDDDNQPIRCSLTAHNLDEISGWYTALSYTWGEPVFDGRMTVDGKELHIIKNLEAALRQLRKPGPPANDGSKPPWATYWWVDAVCINQGDVEERNSQVALMRMIYSSANGVRVWLGEAADDSDLAIDVMRQIMNLPRRGPGLPPVTVPVVAPDEKLRTWRALRGLFACPWWDRAWIRQEVALNKLSSSSAARLPLASTTPILPTSPSSTSASTSSTTQQPLSQQVTVVPRCPSGGRPSSRPLSPS